MFAKAIHLGFAQRVVATLVACALVLWSVGVYSIAQAANLTTISDTLSDSDVSVVSDHTIVFTTPSGVANGDTIIIDFSDGPFVFGSVDDTEVDIATTTDYSVGAACGAVDVSAVFAGNTLTLTMCVANGQNIPVNATTTIEIGLNATADAVGGEQITNPIAGSYEIVVTAGTSDTGRLRVAIIDNVLVTAIVQTSFDFTIAGLATSTAVNGTSTTGSTTATLIPFGVLVAGEIETLAQRLTVSTNARNGFVVTVETDGDLASATGAIIDTFIEGSDHSTAGQTWLAPVPIVSDQTSWGHWGMTYDDDATVTLGNDEFIAASTTPREVFSHTGPADGTTVDIGTTTVGYQIEITALQEAADDYNTTLTYIATPTF